MGEPAKHPVPEFPLSALEAWLRTLIREEIQAANQNGHNDQNGAELLTAQQAGERWNIPASKIKAMARQGQLPCVRLGHYVRFSPADLARFIEGHKE
ncbi:MAG: helix-turn-helix domain-containing protein [Deltaproteobacteria bacterium]|nr:helix-turn-helix domain-containing protein [Deltaproteobacteria bacterium]